MALAGILFDLEGVLLKAKTFEILPFAREALQFCREEQLPFGIITNNTVETPASILGILSDRKLGIEESQLLTPLKFLKDELVGVEKALVIGSDNLHNFVVKQGVEVSSMPNVDVVICGGSYSITNMNLYSAFSAISENNSRFLCLHRNRIFKDMHGITRPDVGSIVVGLEYSTGIPAKTLGKPSPEYFKYAIRDWKLDRGDILLISDDPVSDLGGGKAVGFQTGFVCTGKYNIGIQESLDIQPDMVWPSLDQAIADLARLTSTAA